MTDTAERLDWDALPETVREFLAAVSGGAVIERGGKPTVRVVPITTPPVGDGEWTPAKNQRRCELVDRKIGRSITPEELEELDALTQQMRRYVRKVAPRPLDEIRQLHQELLEEAAKRRAGG